MTYSPVPEKRFGLGDIQPSFFLAPAQVDRWTWRVGSAFQLPTATSDELGTGKWSAGPTGALIYTEGRWFAGVLVGPHRVSREPNLGRAKCQLQLRKWLVHSNRPNHHLLLVCMDVADRITRNVVTTAARGDRSCLLSSHAAT
jgi:hypothetical protein